MTLTILGMFGVFIIGFQTGKNMKTVELLDRIQSLEEDREYWRKIATNRKPFEPPVPT